MTVDTFFCALLHGETDTSGYPDYNAIVGGLASHWDELSGELIVRAVIGWGGKGQRGDTERIGQRILSSLYQQVIAPFDGVITQRNIDKGSLVQADTTTSTFLFAIMQGDVIRTQVFVPQDEAFGVRPGDKAVVEVPEIPGRTTGVVNSDIARLRRDNDWQERTAAMPANAAPE